MWNVKREGAGNLNEPIHVLIVVQFALQLLNITECVADQVLPEQSIIISGCMPKFEA